MRHLVRVVVVCRQDNKNVIPGSELSRRASTTIGAVGRPIRQESSERNNENRLPPSISQRKVCWSAPNRLRNPRHPVSRLPKFRRGSPRLKRTGWCLGQRTTVVQVPRLSRAIGNSTLSGIRECWHRFGEWVAGLQTVPLRTDQALNEKVRLPA
jgi:hypothetical protein